MSSISITCSNTKQTFKKYMKSSELMSFQEWEWVCTKSCRHFSKSSLWPVEQTSSCGRSRVTIYYIVEIRIHFSLTPLLRKILNLHEDKQNSIINAHNQGPTPSILWPILPHSYSSHHLSHLQYYFKVIPRHRHFIRQNFEREKEGVLWWEEV